MRKLEAAMTPEVSHSRLSTYEKHERQGATDHRIKRPHIPERHDGDGEEAAAARPGSADSQRSA
jgi:hypothetical protein